VAPSEGFVPSQFSPPTAEVTAEPLEVKPFDDALAWGTGERSSRAVSAQDVEAAAHEHEKGLAPPSELIATGAEETPHVAAESLPTEDAWMGGPSSDAWSGRASLQTRAVDLDHFTLDKGEMGEFDIQPEARQEGAPDVPEGAPEVPEADAQASLADLPIIMPEDVTPPEELARPAARQAGAEPEPAPPEAAAAAPLPLLTETMAELYLKQGFHAEAVDVYRRLLEQRPGDDALRAKLAALEAPAPALSASALGTESARSWLRRVAQARIDGPPPAAAAPPAGPSPLEQAFTQPEPPAEVSGEPARPAPDAFTLDAIFGASGGAPPSEATPPPPPPTGTSFYEFFGAPPEQGSVRPEQGDATAAAPPDDDVTSFNSWLRGLKR